MWKRKTKSKKGYLRCRLYRVWLGMRERCNNPNRRPYHRYGGRGITVCDEWSEYAVFRRWAVSSGYRKGLTIDRIDNDKGYEPSNCQWLTRSENTAKATVDNPRRGSQLTQSKLNEDDVREIRRRHANGETCTAISKDYGVTVTTISYVVNRKWWQHVD